MYMQALTSSPPIQLVIFVSMSYHQGHVIMDIFAESLPKPRIYLCVFELKLKITICL